MAATCLWFPELVKAAGASPRVRCPTGDRHLRPEGLGGVHRPQDSKVEVMRKRHLSRLAACVVLLVVLAVEKIPLWLSPTVHAVVWRPASLADRKPVALLTMHESA